MRPRIVVDTPRPRRWRTVLALLLGVALAVGLWLLVGYIRSTFFTDLQEVRGEVDHLRGERAKLSQQLAAARGQVADLQEKLVYSERSREIDEAACDSVRKSVTKLQSEAADLREQLAFYRGIVSPEQARAGVRVYEFHLSSTEQASVFRFDLVLIQSVRQSKRVEGHVELSIVAHDAQGQEVTLPWQDVVSDEDRKNLIFSLKYFEEFSGELHIPEGMEPLRVQVRLVPDQKGGPVVEDSFEWRMALGADKAQGK